MHFQLEFIIVATAHHTKDKRPSPWIPMQHTFPPHRQLLRSTRLMHLFRLISLTCGSYISISVWYSLGGCETESTKMRDLMEIATCKLGGGWEPPLIIVLKGIKGNQSLIDNVGKANKSFHAISTHTTNLDALNIFPGDIILNKLLL